MWRMMGAPLDVSGSLDVGGWLDGSVVGCERVVGWERRWTLAGKQDGVVERWRNDNGWWCDGELNQNKES